MSSVFVSYSRADAAPVGSIATRLSEHGYDVWWDKRLRGGEDFTAAIESALAGSKCAVVAWSKVARNSLWVKAEANSAREDGKLVQLTLDGSKPPLPFSALHTIDFSGGALESQRNAFGQLVVSIEAVTVGGAGGAGTQELDTARERSSGVKLAGFGPVAAVGGASIGLVILAAGLVGLGTSRELSADAFGVVSGGMFLAAIVAFGHMLTRVVITFLSSKQ